MKDKPRIALVEDDGLINRLVALGLQRAGYQVDACHSAEELLPRLDDARHDLFVVDLFLPGMSGTELLAELRRRGIAAPLLVISVNDSLPDRVGLLHAGADDYLIKPFAMDELLARVHALLRRAGRDGAAGSLELNGWAVDLAARSARRGGETVTLSETEARLLAFFHAHPRRTLERADILEEVWGMESDPTPRTVDTFVWRLRRLFESDPENPRLFLTVRAVGYRFEP